MNTYRTTVTIDDPKMLVLEDVPFEPGQRVEILVLPHTDGQTEAVTKLKSLLAQTQALPQVQRLTDEDIAAEVAAYRDSQ